MPFTQLAQRVNPFGWKKLQFHLGILKNSPSKLALTSEQSQLWSAFQILQRTHPTSSVFNEVTRQRPWAHYKSCIFMGLRGIDLGLGLEWKTLYYWFFVIFPWFFFISSLVIIHLSCLSCQWEVSCLPIVGNWSTSNSHVIILIICF